MKIIAMLLIALLLFSVVFMSGCVTSDIQNPEDVSKAVNNISSGVEDIESILTDIDEDLG